MATAAREAEAERFAADLVSCIRTQAAHVAASAPEWADRCRSPTNKMDLQVDVMHATLGPMYAKHGYTGALWCTFYTTVMKEEPFFAGWRDHMLCPWQPKDECLEEQLGKHGDESLGVPLSSGNDRGGQPLWRGEANARVMSCGLCGHLARTLETRAPYKLPFPQEYNTPRLRAHRSIDNDGNGWWNEWGERCSIARVHAARVLYSVCSSF